MIGLWLLVAVLGLVALGVREARFLLLPIVIVLVAFGLMCERGQREKDKESE